jgi:hypothetical protein
MAGKKRKFYIKMSIDPELDAMDRMFMSEDIDEVNKWDGEQRHIDVLSKKHSTKRPNSFRRVALDFERTMNTFQTAVPFIMQNSAMMRQFTDDRYIRGFLRDHGEISEKGLHEIYELDVDFLPAFTRELERCHAIRAGISTMPRLFILGLVSAYDVFLSNLIRVIFLQKPETLSSSQRMLSFKELVEIGSIEEARDGIIEKEVEAIIRSSHSDQFEWLEKKLDMPLRKDLVIWPSFIEICERRNLFTHTGGVVSSQYRDVCKAHGYNVSDPIGSILHVSPEYYKNAVEIILELGMKLTQTVWRKLLPEAIDDAANELNEFGYRLILKRKYNLAAIMYKFGLGMKKQGSDATKKRMVVNYANAIKLGGDGKKAEIILNSEDWSASTDLYRICVAAVKDDVDTVVSMMKDCVKNKHITIQNIREWPVFETMRESRAFAEVFEMEFGEKLLRVKETIEKLDSDLRITSDTPSDDGEIEDSTNKNQAAN